MWFKWSRVCFPLLSGGPATVCCGCRPPLPPERDSWERLGPATWFQYAIVFSFLLGSDDARECGDVSDDVHVGSMSWCCCHHVHCGVAGDFRVLGESYEAATGFLLIIERAFGGARGCLRNCGFWGAVDRLYLLARGGAALSRSLA